MKSKQKGYTLIELMIVLAALLCVVGAGGWVANIIKLFNASEFALLEAFRLIGIFAVPLGMVLGFL